MALYFFMERNIFLFGNFPWKNVLLEVCQMVGPENKLLLQKIQIFLRNMLLVILLQFDWGRRPRRSFSVFFVNNAGCIIIPTHTFIFSSRGSRPPDFVIFLFRRCWIEEPSVREDQFFFLHRSYGSCELARYRCSISSFWLGNFDVRENNDGCFRPWVILATRTGIFFQRNRPSPASNYFLIIGAFRKTNYFCKFRFGRVLL